MKNRVTVHIAGENYVLLTDESTAYMQHIAQMVDEKICESRNLPGMSLLKSTMLAACNLADESCKATQMATQLQEQVAQIEQEMETLRRELEDSQRMLDELTKPQTQAEENADWKERLQNDETD